MFAKNGTCSWCKRCYADYEKLRRKDPKVKAYNENYQLQHYYGITAIQYKNLLLEQNNKCAICNKEETQKSRGTLCMLSVDHCHTTNKVRGLLCHKCNKAIGLFNDNVQNL